MNDINLWYLLAWKFIMRCRTCEVTLASVDDINDEASHCIQPLEISTL